VLLKILRFAPAWLLGILFSYFTSGFLFNFYTTRYEALLLTFIIHSAVSPAIYRLLTKQKAGRIETGITFALFGVVLAFTVFMFQTAAKFPSLFTPSFYLIPNDRMVSFILAIAASLPFSVWILIVIKNRKFDRTRFFQVIDENLSGLFLAAFFFSFYLIFASIFNQPVFDVDDIFFDADSNLWRWRFATENYRDYYWRSVHPFVLIIIRPLVSLISLFFKGNTLYATFVLTALTGALCVFLVWYFVKNVINNSLYALLIAAIFGASTAQLVYGSLIETYIFLAAAALIFLVLLLKDRSTFALVIAGLVAFGITISNFGQTVIAHLLVKRDFKAWVKYGLIVAALVIPLTLLNNWAYPNSQPYFFDLSTYGSEGHNSFPPTVQRANYLGRVMLLHSFVAPQPLILEEEIPFLKVWMFRASIKKDPMRISQYENWFSTSVASIWFALILLGGSLFLKNLRKQDNRFSFAIILILLFNFALHMQYGKDVFLYATNWTYAITLFFALAWRELAEKRWFQVLLLVFLGLVLANNSQLFYTMLSTSALHIK
jgi:hypothetical protein